MRIEDLWRWELERRLAVRRWHYEDADAASEAAWAEASRAPVLEARRVQLVQREREAELMRSGEVGPDLIRERLERIEREDAEWRSCTSRWEGEDQARTLRREQIEGQRAVEIERWIEEDSLELFALDAPPAAARRVLQ
jgi:hypothetical protein